MIVGNRRFRPPLWSVVLTLAGMAVFIALGMWQLERAALKENIQAKFEQQLAEPYRPLADIGESADLEYRRLLLHGRYDNARNLLIDNQLHRGRAGYYILTPLELRDRDHIVLVNRGWAPWGELRDLPAQIETPVALEGVSGIAYFPSEPAVIMGDVPPAEHWPMLLPFIDVEALQGKFANKLLPWVLWLAPEQPGAYLRDWNPVWMRPEKSEAYALQWFAFAGLALIFFIILNLRKIE